MPSGSVQAAFEARLKETGALLAGHFQLSSGLHSERYVQCAQLLQHPVHAEFACRALAEAIAQPVDVVVGPALGGVIVAHEVARALGVRSVFCERKEGVMQLRRGFGFAPGERVLVVEDVITTGLTVEEAIACVRAAGGTVVAVASLVDRSGGQIDFGVPFTSVLPLSVEAYSAEQCPLCAAGVAWVKPGSREQAPV